MTAVLNIADLIGGDNAAEYRRLPVIIGRDQCTDAIVELQCGISQYIWKPILCELRANGANDDPLWSNPLNNETANHHVVARLNEAAGADVAYLRTRTEHQ